MLPKKTLLNKHLHVLLLLSAEHKSLVSHLCCSCQNGILSDTFLSPESEESTGIPTNQLHFQATRSYKPTGKQLLQEASIPRLLWMFVLLRVDRSHSQPLRIICFPGRLLLTSSQSKSLIIQQYKTTTLNRLYTAHCEPQLSFYS